MKSFSYALSLGCIFTACFELWSPTPVGSAMAAALSNPALAADSDNPCVVFAHAKDSELKTTSKLDPSKTKPSAIELGLIQAAVLMSSVGEGALSQQEALDRFNDVEGGGSNAGTITYATLTVRGKPVSVGKVTFYPGGNEIGALFRTLPGSKGKGIIGASLIGTISDIEIQCLVNQ